MENNKQFEILEKVYQLTDNTTPRSFDCGELCNKKCCKNLSKSKHESGMALLPYEKDFLCKKGASYTFEKNDDSDVLICNGKCKRELRPFACRIFPYYIDIQNKSVKIKKDLRAASVCPLLLSKVRRRPNAYFLRSMRSAGKLLLSEPAFYDYLSGNADFIGCLYDLYSKLEQ